MENEIEDVDSPTNDETEDSTNEESTQEVDVEALQQKVQVLEKKNQELYEQNKKARGFVRDEHGEWVKKEPKPEGKTEAKPEETRMSETDLLALLRADVPDEDLAYVKKYATLEGVSVADALKKPDLREILKTKQEMRKTAEATNVSASRRAPAKVSDETLLEKAKKGDLPESDEEIARLADLYIQKKKKK